MNRRNFLTQTALGASGLALAFNNFLQRAEAFAQPESLTSWRAFGYGESVPAASKNTGETYITLPKGFEYNVIGKKGGIMSDNRQTPRAHDGMETFELRGELRIIRNHEVNDGVPQENVAIADVNHYDETAGGGTTTLVINPKTREITRDFVSLSGTLNNCGGGKTPWGSWISCEETTLGTTKFTTAEGKEMGGFAKPHGYCFEVSASANNNLKPVPLGAMGRFAHEGVAVDRKTGIIYQTEDSNPAGFYRFLPKRNKRLAEGGTLQILAVTDKPNYDTRKNQKMKAVLDVSWMTIDDPDPIEADVDSQAVFKQGAARGAAIFARLEGCYPAKDGKMYFVSTSGGDNRGGQIWLYEPEGRNGGRLMLVFESPSREILDMPDNIYLNPKNDLLFICEDSDYVGEGGTVDNYLRILTPSGKISDFAKNITPGYEKTEFAGVSFSKNGETMFVNLQVPGVTLAIWGDWSKFRS